MQAPNKRTRPNRRVIWILLVALLLVAGAAATIVSLTRAASQAEPAQAERAVSVNREPHRVTVAGPGTLEAGTSIDLTVAAGLSGRIAEIAEVGQRVDAGERLASLDPTAFERSLKVAEFNLQRAQAQLRSLESNQAQAAASARQQRAAAESAVDDAERTAEEAATELALTERLESIGAESAEALRAARTAHADAQRELETARADRDALLETHALQRSARENDLRNSELSVSQAELDLEEARAALDSLTVTAPFGGVVAQVNVVVGASVNDSTALLTLIDDATLSLVVQIDETQVGTVARGMSATVSLDALPGGLFNGTVTSVSPVARLESNIAIFDVIVTLPNESLEMRPGMTAEASITVREVADSITVPSEALIRDGNGVTVRVVTEGGVEERQLELVESVGFQSVLTGDLEGVLEVLIPGSGGAAPGSTAGRGASQPRAPAGVRGGFPLSRGGSR